MKVIIAGSRTIDTMNKLVQVRDENFRCLGNPLAYALLGLNRGNYGFKQEDITEIISGGARGVDRLGEKFAKIGNIKLTVIKPNWKKYGKKAGFLRNKEMVDKADALIAIWDGKSKGTKHTIDLARKKGIPIYLEIINDN